MFQSVATHNPNKDYEVSQPPEDSISKVRREKGAVRRPRFSLTDNLQPQRQLPHQWLLEQHSSLLRGAGHRCRHGKGRDTAHRACTGLLLANCEWATTGSHFWVWPFFILI